MKRFTISVGLGFAFMLATSAASFAGTYSCKAADNYPQDFLIRSLTFKLTETAGRVTLVPNSIVAIPDSPLLKTLEQNTQVLTEAGTPVSSEADPLFILGKNVSTKTSAMLALANTNPRGFRRAQIAIDQDSNPRPDEANLICVPQGQ